MAPLGEAPSEDMIRSTFAGFREALQRAAEPLPLLLVLDHFSSEREGLPAAHFKYLWEHLIARIGAGEVKNVKMVVVLSKTEKERDYGNLSDLEQNYAEIPIGGLPREQFAELGRELYSLVYPGTKEGAQPIIDRYFQLQQGEMANDWRISVLAQECESIKALLGRIPGVIQV
jgi:hypothetical protein